MPISTPKLSIRDLAEEIDSRVKLVDLGFETGDHGVDSGLVHDLGLFLFLSFKLYAFFGKDDTCGQCTLYVLDWSPSRGAYYIYDNR